MPLSRINSAAIANSAVVAVDIADGTITAAKIISVANTQITGTFTPSQIGTGNVIINSTTISGNYSITSGVNGLSVGPMTIANGVSVTVTSGQRWLVL